MPNTAGYLLRIARESKDLSLEQVANVTHIRLKYLEALENDQIDLLPSPIQGRGFLRLYAEFLDLDPLALLQVWDERDAEISGDDVTPGNDADVYEPDTAGGTPQQFKPDSIAESVEPDEPVGEKPESIKLFTTIGNTLRQRRELLGLSLEDVEQVTHLRIHYLKLIEAGQVNDLPSLVQARGMLQNYARFLEMDTDSILLQYAQGLEARRLELLGADGEKTSRRQAGVTRPSLARRLVTPDMLIGIGLILVLMTFVVWSASQASAVRRGLATPTLLPISELLAVTTSTDINLNTETPTVVFTRPPGEDNVLPTSGGDAGLAPTEAFIDTSVLQIQVIAKQRTWLKVISDGEEVFNARLVPGNAYQFSGNELVEVTTGNAVAIQVFFNSSDLGSLGVTGQVVALQFTRSGILTPTAAFSPAPTATPLATVTLAPTPTVQTPTVTPFIP